MSSLIYCSNTSKQAESKQGGAEHDTGANWAHSLIDFLTNFPLSSHSVLPLSCLCTKTFRVESDMWSKGSAFILQEHRNVITSKAP